MNDFDYGLGFILAMLIILLAVAFTDIKYQENKCKDSIISDCHCSSGSL